MSETAAVKLSDHVGRMYRVALRIVGDANDAHDIVQDAGVNACDAVIRRLAKQIKKSAPKEKKTTKPSKVEKQPFLKPVTDKLMGGTANPRLKSAGRRPKGQVDGRPGPSV